MTQLYVFPVLKEDPKKELETEIKVQKQVSDEVKLQSALIEIGLSPYERERLYFFGADGLGHREEEVRKLLQGLEISSGSIDALFSSKNKTNSFGDDTIVFSPRPEPPSVSLSSFANSIAEAMSALSRIRSKNEQLDSEMTIKKLDASVTVMKEKIKNMKASAKVAVNDAKIAEKAMKELKKLQALMAILGIFLAILMAILTVLVTIATAGVGTGPMIAATSAAVVGGVGGVITSSLALSDAMRTDGKSWMNNLAASFIGKEDPSNSAEKNAAIRQKTEHFKTSLSALEAFFQALLAIISFGATSAASIANVTIKKSMDVVLKIIQEMMRQNIFKMVAFLTSILSNASLAIFTSLMQSGALARSLGGDQTGNALIDSTKEKKAARIKQLQKSQFYKNLVDEKGTAQAKKEIETLAEKEQKALLSGDINTIVSLRALFMGHGTNISPSLRKKLEKEALLSIKYTSSNATGYYNSVVAQINQDYQKMMMGMMLALSIMSMMASMIASGTEFKFSKNSNQVPDLPTTLNSLIKPFASNETVQKINAMNPKKFIRGTQGLQFIGSIVQTTTGAVVSIQQSESELRTLEAKKETKLNMSALNRELMLQEFELYLIRILAEGAFQIQEAHIASIKKMGEAFADFWKTAAQTFSVGIRTRV